MKRLRNIIFPSFLIAMTLCFTSCGKEDAPVVDVNDPTDNFIPGEDEMDATAEMRRKFKEEEGSYLLFNDTIQKKELGIDIMGNTRYFVEVVDVNYMVGATSINTHPYTYTYLKTEEKRTAAVEYLKKYVLNHISKARTVGTKESEDAATTHGQRDIAERDVTVERLGDISHFNKILHLYCLRVKKKSPSA